jgi:hypothetical protein
MRKFALAVVAASLSWSAAQAGAREDSQALYGEVAKGSATFLVALKTAEQDPQEALGRIVAEVREPVGQANSKWMAAMSAGKAADYLAFESCNGAASSVEVMSDKLRRFLTGQQAAPGIDQDTDYFRLAFTRCERALGLAATFPEVAQRLDEEGD